MNAVGHLDEFHCEYSVSFDFIDNNFKDITNAEHTYAAAIMHFVFCCQVSKLVEHSSVRNMINDALKSFYMPRKPNELCACSTDK